MKRILAAVLLQALWLAGCGGESSRDVHGEDTVHTEEDASTGPHGGRLLQEAEVTVELAIFEMGIPPEFRAWITRNGAAVDPSEVELAVTLTRLGGEVDRIGFTPAAEFLRGDTVVREPHSFDVEVTATITGQAYQWRYASYEGRTTIAADVARTAGIETAVASSGVINETIHLFGTIGPDTTRVRDVRARFPGVIRSVHKQIGDTVRAGELLATVESNESLQEYQILAPLAGVITERHAETGEQTDDGGLFEIADFSRVWAEFSVFPRDRPRLRTGQKIHVTAESGETADATISYLAPTGNRESQRIIARAVLDNAAGRWTPGQFVEARAVVSETPAALVVPLSALQTFRDFTVVFAQVGDTYEVRMLTLGRRDEEYVEVLEGLSPGTVYVTGNSYLLKADIEKSGAAHEH